jgi:hypothetical protein
VGDRVRRRLFSPSGQHAASERFGAGELVGVALLSDCGRVEGGASAAAWLGRQCGMLVIGCEVLVGCAKRDNASMRIERSRENVFTVTATSQELSALVAGARMALEAMRTAPEPPPREAVEILERVLREFDIARERLARGPDAGG